jgi:hypothetical protein
MMAPSPQGQTCVLEKAVCPLPSMHTQPMQSVGQRPDYTSLAVPSCADRCVRAAAPAPRDPRQCNARRRGSGGRRRHPPRRAGRQGGPAAAGAGAAASLLSGVLCAVMHSRWLMAWPWSAPSLKGCATPCMPWCCCAHYKSQPLTAWGGISGYDLPPGKQRWLQMSHLCGALMLILRKGSRWS